MKEKAFTLLEITVVVSIIILLSTIFIANYRAGEKNFSLLRSTHLLAQEIREVQEMAMGGKEFSGAFPQGGYGIYLETGLNSYILFADCNANGEYEESVAPGACGDILSETVRQGFLEEDIIISELSSGTVLEITFLPPDPTIAITGGASEAVVSLSFDGQNQRTITINRAGLIDVQ